MANTALQQIPNFNQMEIVKQGNAVSPACTVSIGTTGWNTNTTVNSYPHGLGYRPTVEAYLFDGTFYNPLNYNRTATNFGLVNFYSITIQVYADATNIYIANNLTFNTISATSLTISTSNVKYFLKRPTAS